MRIYNLLECSSNYSDTTGRLSFYSKEETGITLHLLSKRLNYWKTLKPMEQMEF